MLQCSSKSGIEDCKQVSRDVKSAGFKMMREELHPTCLFDFKDIRM